MPLDLFERYQIHVRFRERVYGGVPKNPHIFDSWANSKQFPPEIVQENTEEVGELDETVEAGETVFRRDATGIFLREFQGKACLKEAAQRLGFWQALRRNPDGLGLKSAMQTAFYLEPRRIYLMRDGKVLTDPDGSEESQGRVPTPKGPKSILRKSEYIERPEVLFQIKMLPFKGFGLEELEMILTLGQEIGLGSWRSREEGKYDLLTYQLISMPNVVFPLDKKRKDDAETRKLKTAAAADKKALALARKAARAGAPLSDADQARLNAADKEGDGDGDDEDDD